MAINLPQLINHHPVYLGKFNKPEFTMKTLAAASNFCTTISKGISILLFVSTVYAGPTGHRSSQSCATQCKVNDPAKFSYETGTAYVYDYISEIQTLVLDETVQKSRLQLSSKVEIQVLSACELNLQLREVRLQDPGSDGILERLHKEEHLTRALEKHSLRFAFQDGQIEHLCPHEEEPIWVTNVKRGVLSMFQNTMEDLQSEAIVQETDINGKCPTQYTQSGSSWGGSTRINKIKDISTCVNRKHHIIAIQSIPYTSNPSTSLLSGYVDCTHTILRNKIERVNCLEEQKFKPFDQNNSGAKNIISQTLVLSTSYSHNARQVDSLKERKSLLFEADFLTTESNSDTRPTLNVLAQLEEMTIPDVKAEAPTLFMDLVENLRQLNEPAILALINTVSETPSKKFLMNALPLVNTAPSLKVMTDFYLSEKLTDDHTHAWLSSVAFIKYPTTPLIQALMPLLKRNNETQVLLSVSSVMYSYCKNVADCSKDEMIQRAIKAISARIGDSCRIMKDEQNIRTVILALKALGNVGVYPSSSGPLNIPFLEKCFGQKSNPTQVRLAAMDAHRRMACSVFSNSPFLKMYSDMSENTEVRIEAYLIAMRCAGRKTLEVVQNVLHNEMVNQVGSFVWTHLTNLQETSRPEKQQIRNLLANEILKNKFQTDARKFSRNFESSMFSEDYNIGTGFDSNVIFTEESFLPKSAMANFSFQLFGETVNLLELGGRVNAAESLLEPLFGPTGYFPDESMSSFLKNTRKKREVPTQAIERLPSIYEAASSNIDESPGGSFYARIFGHEVMYKDFEVTTESSIPNVVDEKGKKWLNIKTILDNLSTGKKTELTRSNILMDVSYSVPTSVGIPLSLVFQAATTVGIVAEGKFNVGKFMEKKELEIYGLLRPNFALNLDASLTVRIGPQNNFIRSGLSVQNVLRSSTAIETQVEIKGLQALKAQINLPQKRQDIFEASSKVVLLKPSWTVEALEPVPGTPEIQYEACLGDKFTSILGLKLCGEITAPGNFTLTPSPSAGAVLYLEKTDDFDGYKIDYKFHKTSSETKLSVELDTPGSKISRRTAFTFVQEHGAGSFQATLETPSKFLEANGVYTQLQKSLDVSIVDDGERLLQLNSSLDSLAGKITPTFNLIVFKRPIAELKGVIQLPITNGDQKQTTVNLTLQHVTHTPIRILGNFLAKEDSHEITLGVESYYLTGNLRSHVKHRLGHWSSRSVLEYSWKHGDVNTVDVSAKLQRSQKGALSKFTTAANFAMSKFPDHNLDLSWEMLTSNGFCENVAKFSIGKSTWDAHTLYSLQNTRHLNELRILLSLANLRDDVNYLLEFGHRMVDHSVTTKFVGRTSDSNEIKAKFQYDTLSKPFMHKNVSAEITWPGSEYSFQTYLMEKRKGEFDGELLIHLNTFKEMKATISYINTSNNSKLDHLVEFRARGFFSVPISGSLAFSVTDTQSHIGCQILVEGKKPYSSRLSTSIDYSHIRNIHKIEAKVTFNDRKYNSEVIFGHTKSGTRHLTVDLFLEKHIFMEAKITGSYPESITASFSLVPNKGSYPLEKLELKGLLSSKTLEFQGNYFGEKVSLAGKLGEGSLSGEVEWGANKRITIACNLMNMNLAEGYIFLQLSSPFDGYNKMGLHWEHEFNPKRWATKLAGNIEDRSLLLQFTGVMNPDDLRAKGIIDISGHPTLETDFALERSDNRNNFQLAFSKGDESGLLNIDYKFGAGSSALRLEFRGCKFLPEVLIHGDQKLLDRHKTNLQLEWALPNSVRNTFNLQLEQGFTPMAYNLSITTPWKVWKSLSGHLTLDHSIPTYTIEINNVVDLHLIPRRISLGIQGPLSSFDHHATIQTQNNLIELSLMGSIKDVTDASVTGAIKSTDHHYICHLRSQNVNGLRKLEFTSDFDRKKSEIGVELSQESGSGKEEITAWGNILSGTQKRANFLLEKDDQLRKISFSISDNKTYILKLDADLVWASYLFWNLNLDLKSSFGILPSLTFASSHNMIDLNKISNVHHLRISPKDGSFWAKNVLSARNYSSEIIITNLETVYSLITWDSNNLNIEGEIVANNLHCDITSTNFHPISVDIKYESSNTKLLLSTTVLSSKKNILDFEMNGSNLAGKTTLTATMVSSRLSKLDAQFSLDKQELETFIKMDQRNVIHLNAQAQVKPEEANFKLKSKSSVFPTVDNIVIDTMYKLGSGNIDVHAKYVTNYIRYHISGSGSWSDDKIIKISSEGDLVAAVEVSLDSKFSKFIAIASHNKKKLGELQINYETQPTDYGWGKHHILTKFIKGDGTSTEISSTVSADPKKFDLKIVTPFSSWSQLKIYWDLDMQSIISKYGKFGIEKDQDKLDCSFEMKHFKRNGTTIIGTEINILGFKSLRKFLLETEELKRFQSVYALEGKFVANAQWSPTNIEVQIRTPTDRWRNLKFTGNWDTKRNSKHLTITCDINEEHHEIRSSLKLGTNTEIDFHIQCHEVYDGKLKYDFSKDYKADFQLQGPNTKWTGSGVWSKEGILINTVTPLKNYERIQVKAFYSNYSATHQEGSLSWSVNGNNKALGFDLKRKSDGLSMKVRTPIEKWNEVNLTLDHNDALNQITLNLERSDNQKIVLAITTNLIGEIGNMSTDAAFHLNATIQTPFEQYNRMLLFINYNRALSEHTAVIQYNRNDETIKLAVNFLYHNLQSHTMDIQVDLSSYKNYSSKAQATLSVNTMGNSSFAAVVEYNKAKHEVNAALDLSKNNIIFELHTTLPFLKVVKVSLITSDEILMHGLWEGEDQLLDLNCFIDYHGLNDQRVNVSIVSPFDGFRHILFDANLGITDKMVDSSFTFENENSRWLGKVGGSHDSLNGNWKIQINTPLEEYHDISVQVKHTWGSGKELSYNIERNSLKFISLEVSLKQDRFQLALDSAILEFPIVLHFHTSSKQPLVLQASLGLGEEDYKTNFEVNIQGLDSGMIHLRSLAYPGISSHVAWKVDGTFEDGNAWGSFTNSVLGSGSVRTLWRINSWKQVKTEVWLRSDEGTNETGGVFQYSLTTDKETEKKLHVHGTYTSKDQRNAFTLSVKLGKQVDLYSGNFNLDNSFGFIQLRKLQASTLISLDDEGVNMNLNATYNDSPLLQMESKIQLQVPRSKLTLNFNSPIICKPFNLLVNYDFLSIKKSFEFGFKQARNAIDVKTYLSIPQNKQEMEFNFNMSSNVAFVPMKVDGVLKGSYQYHLDGLSEVKLGLESAQIGNWKLVTAIRPTSDFDLNIEFDSAAPEVIPPLSVQVKWRGNQRQGINSNVSLKMWNTALNGTLMLTQDSIRLRVNSSFQLLRDFNLDGNLGHPPGANDFELKVGRHGDIYRMIGSCNFTKTLEGVGLIALSKGEEDKRIGALQFRLDNDGHAEMSGDWSDRKIIISGKMQNTATESWMVAGHINLGVSVDGKEQLAIQSEHKFGDGEYFVNTTIGTYQAFTAHFIKGHNSTLASTLQWEKDGSLKLFAKITEDAFDVTFSSPWTPEIGLNGMLRRSNPTTTVEGHLTYGNQRSSARLETLNSSDATQFNLALDIPPLHQKLVTTLSIQVPNAHVSGGKIDMNLNGRQLSITGEYYTRLDSNVDKTKYKESQLSLSVSFPSKEFKKISTHITLRKPLHHFGSMQINANIAMGNEVSDLAFGYDLHPTDNLSPGITASVDNSIGVPFKYRFSLRSEGPCWRNVDAHLIWNSNEIRGNWKVQLPELRTAVSLSTTSESIANKYKLEIFSNFKPSKSINITLHALCKDKTINAKYLLEIGNQGLTSEAVLQTSQFLDLNHRYKLQLNHSANEKYALKFTGIQDHLNMDFYADLILGMDTLTANGQLTSSLGSLHSRLDYSKNINGVHELNLTVESPSFIMGKRAFVKAELTPRDEGFEASIQCRTRQSTHTTSIAVDARLHNGSVTFALDSPQLQQVLIQAEWKKDGPKFKANIRGNIEDCKNEIEALLDIQNLEGRVKVNSPLIPSSHFNVHLKSLFNPEGIDILGDVKIREYHWRFQTVLKYKTWKQMTAMFELVTPNESFDRLILALKSNEDEIYAEIYTPIAAIPKAMLNVTGLLALETGNWQDMHPGISIGLPFGKYSAFCILKTPNNLIPGVLHLYFEDSTSERTGIFEYLTEISPLGNFNFNMNNMAKVYTRILTPMDYLRTFEVDIQGKVRGRNVIQILGKGQLNENDLTFSFDYENDNGNPKVSSKLTSPFEMYENIAFSLAFDNFQKMGNGQSLHMDIANSHWTEKVTLDADYRYQFKGFFDMEGEVNAALVSFMDIPPVHFKLKTDTKESGALGTLTGTVGPHPILFKVDVDMSEEELSFIIHGSAGEEDSYNILAKLNLLREENLFRFASEISLQQESVFDSRVTFSPTSDVAGADLKLSTPWGPLQSTLTLIPMSPLMENSDWTVRQILQSANVTFNFHFDESRVIGFQLVSLNGVSIIEVYNPISPVSLTLNFEGFTKSKVKLISEFCWNLDDPIGNTVGLGFVWNKGFLGHQLGLNLQAEKAGVLDIKLYHSLSSSRFNQSTMIKWNSPLLQSEGESGYQIFVSKDSSPQYENQNVSVQVQVHLPWRSMVLELLSNRSTKDSLHALLFKWDAKEDDSKFLSLKLHKEVGTAWGVSEISHFLEIIHPLFSHPIMISIDQIYRNNRFQHIEFDLKASPIPQNNFIFLVSRNNTDWKNLKVVVRHIPTNLHITLNTKTSDANDRLVAEVYYMDVSGVTRNLTFAAVSKPDNYELGLYSGGMEHKTDIILLKSHFYQDLVAVHCRLFSFDMDAMVQTSLPFLEMIMKHKGEDKLKIFGGYSHKKKVGIHFAKVESENLVTFLRSTAELTNTNSVVAKVNWLPDFFSYILKLDFPSGGTSSRLSDINSIGAMQGISAEICGRWNQLSPEVRLFVQNVKTFVEEESALFSQEWKLALDYMKEIHRNNSFYLRDVCDHFNYFGDLVKTLMNSILEEWHVIYTSYLEFISQTSESLTKLYADYDGSLEKFFMHYWKEVEEFVTAMWQENVSLVSSLFTKLVDTSKLLLDTLEGKLEEVERKLMAVGLFRKLIQLYQDYATWIDEIPIQEFTKKLENMMNIRIWDRLTNYLAPFIEAIRNGMEDQYFMDLLDTPPLPYIRYSLKGLQTAVDKFWEVLEVEQRMKQLIRTSLKNVDGLIHRYFPTATLTYNFDLGFVEYNQSLSAVQWADFTQLPRWRTKAEEVQDVSQLTNFYYQVFDTIESLKPIFDMNIRSILPPFHSYALMAGDHHYFTFDKRYFRFAGECSYVLVADLAHSSDAFSLIVNYENRDGSVRKKSYSITTTGDVVDIDMSNFKVTVNGKKIELPLNIGSLFIRRHQTGLEMYDRRGFTMSCSLSSSVCTFGVSGWHFGKIGGMLGTFDNEPMNDLRSPNRELVADVSAFAYSWRVGKNSGVCRMKSFAKDDTEVVDIDQSCFNLLHNRSSPLRPCFDTVSTEIFMEMCKYDISRNVNSANRAEAACPAMSAYVTECQKNNVDIWMPPTCVRCRLEDGTALTTGENITLQVNGGLPPLQSSDNVILLEKTSCISSATLIEAIKRLDGALNAEGIWDNRYSVVGFGGSETNAQPHIMTASGKVWAHNTLFKIPNDTDSTPTSHSNLYDAIQYAVALGYRAGVSKNLLAVTCGEDTCGEASRYADILTLLVENDIKLHILAPKPFTLKGNRKQDETNQIYGIDMNGVYTIKHAKSGTIDPDTALKRQINVPKDFCTPLALESNGTRFNIEQPTKKVLDVWSRRVAKTSHPSACQRCECLPDKYGSASLLCHQCVSPGLWKFMEEWKSYQSLDGIGTEDIPLEFFEHEDFIM